MNEPVTPPSGYLKIIKRRKWAFVIPFVITMIVCIVIALALPSVYKSTSTILIEEQEIPNDFVMATVTSYAEQRIQTINQRIMSSTKLLEIINRFNLYAELRDKWTTEEIIQKMREDVQLTPISVEVMDKRTGRQGVATIAFTLSYEGEKPPLVQKVANILASLYLEENLKIRERQAMETSRFLEDEMLKMKESLSALEARISRFKNEHINELPELMPSNLQNLSNTERNIERLEEQLRSLKERKQYLETQLAAVPADTQVSDELARLKELKLQLVRLKTRFTDEYPDVKKVKSEIGELEKKIAEREKKGKKQDRTPDNPMYITLKSQIAGTKSEIDSIQRQLQGLVEKRDQVREYIQATPKVEEEYQALILERNNMKLKFDDLNKKMLEAKVAQGLEKEQKGERFTLIDPARFPEKPFKPNRLAIILIGLVLSIGAGFGLASVMEFTDASVHDVQQLIQQTGFAVLGHIPYIMTEKEKKKRKRRRIVIGLGIIAAVVTAVLLIHFFYRPLDVLWIQIMRKLSRMRFM